MYFQYCIFSNVFSVIIIGYVLNHFTFRAILNWTVTVISFHDTSELKVNIRFAERNETKLRYSKHVYLCFLLGPVLLYYWYMSEISMAYSF